MRDIRPNKPQTPKNLPGSSVPVSNIELPPKEAYVSSLKNDEPVVKKPITTPKPSAPKPTRRPSPKIGSRERGIVFVILLVIGLTALIAAYVFLPSADIKLVLRTSPLLVDQEVAISTDENALTAVSGTTFFRELEVSGESAVSGTEVIGSKATGTVRLINRTVEEQQIKAGSRLVTADGTLFYMKERANIPAGSGGTLGSIDVTVEAAEAGEAGNISEGTLNFAAFSESAQKQVYGEIVEGISGGSGETISVVTASDITKAEENAATQARSQVEQEIRDQLPQGWTLLDESWEAELVEFSTEAKEGDREPLVRYNARVKMQVIGFELSVLEEKVKTALSEQLPANAELFPGPITFNKTIENVDWETGNADIKVRVTHTTIPNLALESLRDKISGTSTANATDYLTGLEGVKDAQITMKPGFITSLPRLSSRISLELVPERQP